MMNNLMRTSLIVDNKLKARMMPIMENLFIIKDYQIIGLPSTSLVFNKSEQTLQELMRPFVFVIFYPTKKSAINGYSFSYQ